MSSSPLRLVHLLLAAVAATALCAACKPVAPPASVVPDAAGPVAVAPVADEPQAAPSQPAPDLVSLEATLANRYVVADEPVELLARLTVVSEGLAEHPRMPVNLALVVDTSASMRGEAIERAREAAGALVEDLAIGDRVSVIAFHSRGEVLVQSVELDTQNRGEVLGALQGLQATGTTALAEGLTLGMQQLKFDPRKDVVSRMVLLSDGVPNDEARVRQVGSTLAGSSVSLTALGLGVEFDEVLLADLASNSGGRFHYVEDGGQVATMFADEIMDIEQLVAQAAVLQLRAGPGVSILEVVGRNQTPAGARTASIPVGDLLESDAREIVIRLAVGKHRDGTSVELFDASLRYSDATAGAGTLESSTFLAAEASADPGQRRAAHDHATELVIVRALTAAAALQAVALARSGDVKRANALVKAAEKRARRLARTEQDSALEALADDLAKIRPTLSRLAPIPAASAKRGPSGPRARGDKSRGRPRAVAPSAGIGISAAKGMKGAHSRAFEAVH